MVERGQRRQLSQGQSAMLLEIVEVETCKVLEKFESASLALLEFSLLEENYPGKYMLVYEGSSKPVEFTFSN